MPPQTYSTWPVMTRDRSEARNATASAMSVGSPNRPVGTLRRSFSRAASSRSRSIGVSTVPGATTLTRTLREDISTASARDMPTTPALEAA